MTRKVDKQKRSRGRPPKKSGNNKVQKLTIKQQNHHLLPVTEGFPHWKSKSRRIKRENTTFKSSLASSTKSTDCPPDDHSSGWLTDFVIPGPIPNLDELIHDSSLFVNFFDDIPLIE